MREFAAEDFRKEMARERRGNQMATSALAAICGPIASL